MRKFKFDIKWLLYAYNAPLVRRASSNSFSIFANSRCGIMFARCNACLLGKRYFIKCCVIFGNENYNEICIIALIIGCYNTYRAHVCF